MYQNFQMVGIKGLYKYEYYGIQIDYTRIHQFKKYFFNIELNEHYQFKNISL
jgi:hypothetical protein